MNGGHLLSDIGDAQSWSLIYNTFGDKLIRSNLVGQDVRLTLTGSLSKIDRFTVNNHRFTTLKRRSTNNWPAIRRVRTFFSQYG